MVEEDAFEGLRVLAAGLGSVTGILEDAVATEAGPGAAPGSRPAGCCDCASDQGMPLVKVGGGAGGLPETAQARQEDALIVSVDAFVALVAFAGADV